VRQWIRAASVITSIERPSRPSRLFANEAERVAGRVREGPPAAAAVTGVEQRCPEAEDMSLGQIEIWYVQVEVELLRVRPKGRRPPGVSSRGCGGTRDAAGAASHRSTPPVRSPRRG
jgi:hypothetical protein